VGQPSVTFQGAADGFRIFAHPGAAGWILTYRHRGPQGLSTGQITLEPSPAGQFVYTGFMPTEIGIVQIVPPARPAVQAPVVPQGRPGGPRGGVQGVVVHQQVVHHHVHHHDDGGSFQGFPPAY
jgi:hypothetical protein